MRATIRSTQRIVSMGLISGSDGRFARLVRSAGIPCGYPRSSHRAAMLEGMEATAAVTDATGDEAPAPRPAPARPPRTAPDARLALDHVVAALDGGEARTGQAAMCDAVASAIAERRHLLVQAGTGTGKSLAYLVPAV